MSGWVAFEDRWPDEFQAFCGLLPDGSTVFTTLYMEYEAAREDRQKLWAERAKGAHPYFTRWRPVEVQSGLRRPTA